MLKLSGMLISTTDINMVRTAAPDPNTKILYIGDPEGNQEMIRNLRLIVAGPWIPNYIVMEADINGIYEEFAARYLDYLMQEESQMLFATLITALYRGKNVILFFPTEAYDFKYPGFLLQYIQNTLGITAATPTTQYIFDTRYSDNLAYLMYYHGTIYPTDFILISESMDINGLTKLIMDLGLPVFGDYATNPKPVLDWIESYKQSMISAGKELIKPMMIGVDCNVDNRVT